MGVSLKVWGRGRPDFVRPRVDVKLEANLTLVSATCFLVPVLNRWTQVRATHILQGRRE